MSKFPYWSQDRRPYAKELRLEFDGSNHPLPMMLQVALPFEIERVVREGGPNDRDYAMARRYADTLGAKGDILLYGGKKREAAKLFADLVRSVAVLSFLPGGITIFGEHYEAFPPADVPMPEQTEMAL